MTGSTTGLPSMTSLQNSLCYERAVQEIISRKEEYMVDMEDYSVWGSSAGGHLAASFGTTKMGYPHYGLPKPSAIILVYPVITLEEEKTHLGSRENLLGKKASEEKALAYSIQTNVDQNYPRTFVWCGDADEAVPPENTKKLAAALKAQGIAYEAHIIRECPMVLEQQKACLQRAGSIRQ